MGCIGSRGGGWLGCGRWLGCGWSIFGGLGWRGGPIGVGCCCGCSILSRLCGSFW